MMNQNELERKRWRSIRGHIPAFLWGRDGEKPRTFSDTLRFGRDLDAASTRYTSKAVSLYKLFPICGTP
jgi:hypothetical protein